MSDGTAVLVVPATENEEMISRMRPVRDIYFIMQYSALEFVSDGTVIDNAVIDFYLT